MKEILRITIALTVSCLLAGLVIGTTFVFTAKAKQHNEHLNVQQTMLALLGYGPQRPVPPDLRLHPIHRYLLQDGGAPRMGYLVPTRQDGGEGYALVVLDVQGQFLEHHRLDLNPAAAMSAEDRKGALQRVLKAPTTFQFADTMIVACQGSQRKAYLLPGEFPGFKTFIKTMVALSADFELLGLEVIEHEEDPGLGGEITQAYFKNQFVGKTFEKIKRLAVVKEPLPTEYERYLKALGLPDSVLSAQEAAEIRQRYREKDIYALTGATISSAAVTHGVKAMTTKFAYRIQVLDQAIDAGKLPVLF